MTFGLSSFAIAALTSTGDTSTESMGLFDSLFFFLLTVADGGAFYG
jgi:hypothetical protein